MTRRASLNSEISLISTVKKSSKIGSCRITIAKSNCLRHFRPACSNNLIIINNKHHLQQMIHGLTQRIMRASIKPISSIKLPRIRLWVHIFRWKENWQSLILSVHPLWRDLRISITQVVFKSFTVAIAINQHLIRGSKSMPWSQSFSTLHQIHQLPSLISTRPFKYQ